MTAGLSAPQKLGAMRQAHACREGGGKCSFFWGAVPLPPTREDSQAAFWPKALLSTLPGHHGFLVWEQSSLLTPLWFADERDPACYGLHQAQPLGQEQSLRTPRGPVCRVSREAEDSAGLLIRTPLPAANRTQAMLCRRHWDPLLVTVWTQGSQPRESCPHL